MLRHAWLELLFAVARSFAPTNWWPVYMYVLLPALFFGRCHLACSPERAAPAAACTFSMELLGVRIAIAIANKYLLRFFCALDRSLKGFCNGEYPVYSSLRYKWLAEGPSSLAHFAIAAACRSNISLCGTTRHRQAVLYSFVRKQSPFWRPSWLLSLRGCNAKGYLFSLVLTPLLYLILHHHHGLFSIFNAMSPSSSLRSIIQRALQQGQRKPISKLI